MIPFDFSDFPLEAAGGDYAIGFESEEIDFDLGEAREKALTEWIFAVVAGEGKGIYAVTFIFCNDDYVYELNKTHLQHDTLTDVITFPYSENPVEGDIFISVDRVRENAATFGVSFEQELYRVMIHGILHLCGYGDSDEAAKVAMRGKEDAALSQLPAAAVNG